MSDIEYVGPEKRENLRIFYPIPERPELMYMNKKYPIVDISEKGLRIGGVDYNLRQATTIPAEIDLNGGDLVSIIGRRLNIDDQTSTMSMIFAGRGLSSRVMVREQRYLARSGYKHFTSQTY